jgi:hypothetical protein
MGAFTNSDDSNHAETLELRDLKRDLARFEQRRAAFVALGDKHLEVPQKMPYPGYGVIEWEPIRSLKTGKELAQGLEDNISALRKQIAAREDEIRELLAA